MALVRRRKMKQHPKALTKPANIPKGTRVKRHIAKTKYYATRHRLWTRKRDPFQVLPDNVVALVVHKLSATDTENLRRVSKTWKATSEFFNANQALRTHFPKVMTKGIGFPNEPNLEFRRLLYHQESLKVGYVKRLLELSDLFFWHINNHRLAYADKSGNVYLRELRGHNNISLDTTHRLDVSRLHTVFEPMELVGLWVLDDGDVLIQTYPTRNTASVSSFTRSKQAAGIGLLARLRPSVPGSILWTFAGQPYSYGTEHTHDTSRRHVHVRPSYAVGKTKIYEMRHDGSHSYKSSWVSTLSIRHLKEPYKCAILHYEHPRYQNWSDCHMILTGDEKFLILKNRQGVVRIISTVNGHVQKITNNSRSPAAGRVINSCVVGSSSSRFWEYRSECRSTPGQFITFMYTYDYDAPSVSFVRRYIGGIDKSDFSLKEIYDFEEDIAFLAKKWTVVGFKDGCYDGEYMEFGLHKPGGCQSFLERTSGGLKTLTVKDPNDGPRKKVRIRRPKERIDSPFTDPQFTALGPCSESYMGMKDGYFINYDSTRGQLLVFDFWPSW